MTFFPLILALLALTTSILSFILIIFIKKEIKRIREKLKVLLAEEVESAELYWGKKIRKRYIVFTILSEQKLSKQDVEHVIREKFKQYFGEQELVKADPQLIYFDPNLQRGIIRTTQLHKDKLLSVFQLIKEVNGIKCLFIPVKTTGTMKKARGILYRFDREYHK